MKTKIEELPSVPYSLVISQRFSDSEVDEMRQLELLPMQFRARINVRAKTADIAKQMAYDYYVGLYGGDFDKDLYEVKLVSTSSDLK